MQIDLDKFFAQATLAGQKKLIKYMFQEPWRNEKSAGMLGIYLQQKQAEAKDAWAVASSKYQNEYRTTKFLFNPTVAQKRSVETANRKMLNEVKRCRTKFERYGKIIVYYESLRTKSI